MGKGGDVEVPDYEYEDHDGEVEGLQRCRWVDVQSRVMFMGVVVSVDVKSGPNTRGGGGLSYTANALTSG